MTRAFCVLAMLAGVPACHLFATSIPCTLDGDCPTDAVCVDHQCAAANEGEGSSGNEGEGASGGEGEGASTGDGSHKACGSDQDCPATEGCGNDSVCRSRCNNDTDCTSADRCASTGLFFGTTVCEPGCRFADDTHDNCGNGTRCSAGSHQCVTAQSQPQQAFGPCASGLECASPFQCFINDGEDRGYCTETCQDGCAAASCCPITGLTDCFAQRCVEDCTPDGSCAQGQCCFVTGLAQCFGGLCTP